MKLTDFQRNIVRTLYALDEQVRGGTLMEISVDLEDYFLKINSEIEKLEKTIKNLKGGLL